MKTCMKIAFPGFKSPISNVVSALIDQFSSLCVFLLKNYFSFFVAFSKLFRRVRGRGTKHKRRRRAAKRKPRAPRTPALTWHEFMNKPILKLTDEDYNNNGMAQLATEKGPAYNINIDVFNKNRINRK